MSDHISGPRALADPIADITDLYAFPSPSHPQTLVLVMNTLPFAQPTDLFSDGLIYRFRLRPLVRKPGADARRRASRPIAPVLPGPKPSRGGRTTQTSGAEADIAGGYTGRVPFRPCHAFRPRVGRSGSAV